MRDLYAAPGSSHSVISRPELWRTIWYLLVSRIQNARSLILPSRTKTPYLRFRFFSIFPDGIFYYEKINGHSYFIILESPYYTIENSN